MAADVSLMVGGIEKQIYLPVTLAQQLGYFRDEGISVEILSEPAGVEAADEMLAGAREHGLPETWLLRIEQGYYTF